MLNSVLHTWVQGRWFLLWEYEHDLVTAPKRLVKAQQLLGESAITIQYEALVETPEVQTRRLCDHLGITFHAAQIRYGDQAQPDWSLGDTTGINTWQRPVGESVKRWRTQAEEAQAWRLMRDYLDYLGPDLLAAMGYDAAVLRDVLDSRRPRSLRFTFSMDWLMQKPAAQRSSREHMLLRNASYLRRGGVPGLLKHWVYRLGRRSGVLRATGHKSLDEDPKGQE